MYHYENSNNFLVKRPREEMNVTFFSQNHVNNRMVLADCTIPLWNLEYSDDTENVLLSYFLILNWNTVNNKRRKKQMNTTNFLQNCSSNRFWNELDKSVYGIPTYVTGKSHD